MLNQWFSNCIYPNSILRFFFFVMKNIFNSYISQLNLTKIKTDLQRMFLTCGLFRQYLIVTHITLICTFRFTGNQKFYLKLARYPVQNRCTSTAYFNPIATKKTIVTIFLIIISSFISNNKHIHIQMHILFIFKYIVFLSWIILWV